MLHLESAIMKSHLKHKNLKKRHDAKKELRNKDTPAQPHKDDDKKKDNEETKKTLVHHQPTADDIGASGDSESANNFADSAAVNKGADAADAYDAFDSDRPSANVKKTEKKSDLPPPKGDVAKKESKVSKHELTPETKVAPLPGKLD